MPDESKRQIPEGAMVPRPSMWGRAGAAIMRALRIVDPVVPLAETHTPGGDFAAGTATGPGYSIRRAWFSYALSPWVQVCVERIAEDLASLPLVAERRAADGSWERVDRSEAVDMLNDPGRGGGLVMRSQFAADQALAANVFLLPLLSALNGRPISITRLHPARVEAIPGEQGLLGWSVDEGGIAREYTADAVIHARGLSWSDDPRGLMGTPPIQALAADLDADLALAGMTKRSAEKGRPDAIYHPSKEGEQWAPRIVALIKRQLESVFSSSHGGVAVLDGAGKLDVIGWSPRDMEGVEARTWTRQTILSRFGVPPTIAGIPDAANYATAQQEAVTYWTRLQARAATLDQAFTELSVRLDQPDLRIRHDFSRVPALADVQTAAVARVQAWVLMGADPVAAAAYEGLEDVPASMFPLPDAVITAAEDDADDADEPTPAVVEVDTAAAEEARDELAAALDALSDPDADPEVVADALGGLRAALDAVEALIAEARA